MTTDRDMTRIVRSWLRTDEHESADRVLDGVAHWHVKLAHDLARSASTPIAKRLPQ